MADMGVISRAIDKMPTWAQLVLAALGLVGFIYGVAHEGWTFILKTIFSPEL
jgi:hypothetical protein